MSTEETPTRDELNVLLDFLPTQPVVYSRDGERVWDSRETKNRLEVYYGNDELVTLHDSDDHKGVFVDNRPTKLNDAAAIEVLLQLPDIHAVALFFTPRDEQPYTMSHLRQGCLRIQVDDAAYTLSGLMHESVLADASAIRLGPTSAEMITG